MKNIVKIGALALALTFGFSSCNDYFDSIPGEWYDMDKTFSNRSKAIEFLNNVYSYVPNENNERFMVPNGAPWSAGSLEADFSWSWHNTNEWTAGRTYASSSWINYYFIEYYKGIAKASTFIQNIDKCAEASEGERTVWKAEARALRAIYYFWIFRSYGPAILLGEEPLDVNAPLDDLLKERNSVDEYISYIADELKKAAADLPEKYNGSNLGHMDRGICMAMRANALLYAASPLFNCNPDYAEIKNHDGKQLYPQDKANEQKRWDDAREAYKNFFTDFVDKGIYELYTVKNNGNVDYYESYRQVTSGMNYGDENKEQILVKVEDYGTDNFEITPYHAGEASDLRGGQGFAATQEMVDLFFMKDGYRIEDSEADYEEYTGIPSSDYYGGEEYKNENSNVVCFEKNTNMTLKQWANRDPRFYVCITFNGARWVRPRSDGSWITTEWYKNGNSGLAKATLDIPYTGYGVRKRAPINGVWSGKQTAILLRLADMYLGYAETLSACGEYGKALELVNKVRERVGLKEYGSNAGQIACPLNRTDVDKRIRRERLVELAFERKHFFDVRRWKVADMTNGDGWIYPSYHRGGEGGEIHGLNYTKDLPEFFEKMATELRVFDKKHYLFPIPDKDMRRNPKMVQNYGWLVEQ